MTLSLPPTYVALSVEIIKQANKPDKPHGQLFFSYVRLLALAWQHEYKLTPRLREEDLYNTKNPDGSTRYGFLKLSRREYFAQKREMELLGWLRSIRPAIGFVQFTFSRAIVVDPVSQEEASAENCTEMQISALPALIVGGDSLDLNLNTDSPPTPLNGIGSAENRTDFPGVVKILSCTDLLFDGSHVVSKDLEHCIPQEVLAWCAYAYSQFSRQRLDRPAGLVRRRLLDGEHASEKMRTGWREILPDEFLDALGLITYACDVCQAAFGKRADVEAHKATHPLTYICPTCGARFIEEIDLDSHVDEEHTPKPILQDESVMVQINGRMSAAQAWETVIGQLNGELPRASFETWVRDTQAVRFHGNALSIGVQNDLAREWLESRLRSTVERLLVGILARRVDVVFVVAAAEVDHE